MTKKPFQKNAVRKRRLVRGQEIAKGRKRRTNGNEGFRSQKFKKDTKSTRCRKTSGEILHVHSTEGKSSRLFRTSRQFNTDTFLTPMEIKEENEKRTKFLSENFCVINGEKIYALRDV